MATASTPASIKRIAGGNRCHDHPAAHPPVPRRREGGGDHPCCRPGRRLWGRVWGPDEHQRERADAIFSPCRAAHHRRRDRQALPAGRRVDPHVPVRDQRRRDPGRAGAGHRPHRAGARPPARQRPLRVAPQARAFARHGYRVLVFDFAGFGDSQPGPDGRVDTDVVAAAAGSAAAGPTGSCWSAPQWAGRPCCRRRPGSDRRSPGWSACRAPRASEGWMPRRRWHGCGCRCYSLSALMTSPTGSRLG